MPTNLPALRNAFKQFSSLPEAEQAAVMAEMDAIKRPWASYEPYVSPSESYIRGHFGDSIVDEFRKRGIAHSRQVQQPFHESQAFIRSVIAGNGVGKTRMGAQELAWFAYGNHPWRQTVQDRVRVGRIGCEKMAWEMMRSRLEALFPEFRRDYNKGGSTYERFWTIYDETGKKEICTFDVMTYDQEPRSWESVELDFLWLDEPPSLGIWRSCLLRFRSCPYPAIWLTMTPLQLASWFVSEVIESETASHEEFRGGIYENPHNPPESVAVTIGSVKDLDELEARTWGGFSVFSGRVFKGWNDCKPWVITDIRYDTFTGDQQPLVYLYIDPHDRKPPAIIWVVVLPTGESVVLNEWPHEAWDELKTYERGPAGVIEAIREEERLMGVPAGLVRRYMDPKFGSGTKSILNIRDTETVQDRYNRAAGKSVFALAPVKDLSARHAAIRDMLELTVHGWPRLRVVESCRNVRRSFNNYRYIEARNPEAPLSERVDEAWKDFIDDIGYHAVVNPGYQCLHPQSKRQAKRLRHRRETGPLDGLTGL